MLTKAQEFEQEFDKAISDQTLQSHAITNTEE